MNSGQTEPTDANDDSRGEEHLVIFRLGSESFGIDIQIVQEIVRMQAITPIPGAHTWIEGVTNLRGRVVAVIDLRTRCGITASEHTAETRIVVANSERGAIGLIVDAVTEVLRIPGASIDEPEDILGVVANGHIRAIARLDDRLVSLVNLEVLLPQHLEVEAAEEDAELSAA
jgi:purine-binding chemotaxis protein CheW